VFVEDFALKILVVEDYAPIRKSVEATLRDSGYAVDSAADGEEGLWAASNGGYDCMVLDWMLPKLSGIDLLTRLRRDANQTPILMLTAKDTLADLIHGLNCGADDYLVKPFSIGELLARIRALIRRHYSSKSPFLTIGSLVLDTVAKRLERNGVLVDLSAREYSLFEYLVLRSGQIVSRTDIWNHLYDFSDDSHSNVVDVYIGYLRKKLESDGSPRVIRTRRGQGYILAAPP